MAQAQPQPLSAYERGAKAYETIKASISPLKVERFLEGELRRLRGNTPQPISAVRAELEDYAKGMRETGDKDKDLVPEKKLELAQYVSVALKVLLK